MGDLKTISGYSPMEFVPNLLMEPHIADPSEEAIHRYVDILNDKSFKAVLGAERNKDALIEILRQLIPDRTIADIRYDNKKRKHNPFIDGHDAIFDVECIDEQGARFVVEMQQLEQENFYDRVLFYSTFPIQEQIPSYPRKKMISQDKQYDYQPVYIVSLMAFSLHPEEQRLLYKYNLRDDQSGELMSDKLSFIFLEMDKVTEEPKADSDVLTKLSWAMMNIKILKERPAALVEKVFALLFEACELDSYEPIQRTTFIEAMTTERDKSNIAYTYWKKGKEEGQKEERISNARKMLEEGLPKDIIQRVTGLNAEDL